MNVIMASKFSEISISIPPEIAVCGICGAEVVLDIDEYEEDDGGLWAASQCGVHVDCVTAPPIDDENAWCSPLCSIIRWRSFMRSHWSSPYLDWLPVQKRVYQWLLQHYRFSLLSEHE